MVLIGMVHCNNVFLLCFSGLIVLSCAVTATSTNMSGNIKLMYGLAYVRMYFTCSRVQLDHSLTLGLTWLCV